MKRKNILSHFDDILASICMVIVIGVTVVGVFMRYVVKSPLAWVEEVSMFFFVWLALLGSASATKIGGHVSIDFIVEKMPKNVRRVIDMVVAIVVSVTLVVIIKYGLDLALQAKIKVTPILRVPYTYIDIAIPIGLVWMLIHYVRLTFLKMKAPQDNIALSKENE